MKLETHMHTAEVSPCGKVAARDMARLYAEAGYKTLVCTDHMNKKTGAAKFLTGWQALKESGAGLGITVLLGAETRLLARGDEDFLVYGLKPEDIYWLDALLQTDPDIESYHRALSDRGLLLVQAHPYRDRLMPAPATALDGMEVFNAHPRHPNHNALALSYATENKLIPLAGSDAHRACDAGRSGLLVPDGPWDNERLLAYLRGGEKLTPIYPQTV